MVSPGILLFISLTFLVSITLFMTLSSTKHEGSRDLYSTLTFMTTCGCWRMQQRRKTNPMQGRLWNGATTREISISSLHPAGRFRILLLPSAKVSNPFHRFSTQRRTTESIPLHNIISDHRLVEQVIHLAVTRRKRKNGNLLMYLWYLCR